MPRLSRYCSKVSQRWLTVVLIFLALLNLYGMRVCLSIAITEMALPHNRSKNFSDDTCSHISKSNSNNSHANLKRSSNELRYDWSEYTQGLILSSFYWGYIVTNFIGGTLTQKFGGRAVFSLSVLFTSTFTLLTPYCVTKTGSTGLIVLRLTMGIAEGTLQPAASDLMSHWVPANERSKAGFIVYGGMPLGMMYGILPSGMIVQHSESGWPMVFYVYGTVGFLSFLLIVAFCHSEPSLNPFISDQELSYLESNMKNKHSKRPPPPLRHIFKSMPVWSLMIAGLGEVYGLTTIMSDMPKYMSSVLKFSAQSNGLLLSIPYLSMYLAGGVFSWIADKLVSTRKMSTIAARKFGCAIAAYGSAIFIIGAAYAGCDGLLTTGLLTVGYMCYSAIFSSTMINPLDLSPNYSGTITGLMSGASTVFAMLAPYVVGVVTPNQTIGEWKMAFWIVFVVMIITNTAFIIYGSANVQEWNDPEFLNDKAANNKEAKEAVDLLGPGQRGA